MIIDDTSHNQTQSVIRYDFEPSALDIKHCHQVEHTYSNTRKYGSEDGFFIKVEPIEIYHRLRETGNLLVAKTEHQGQEAVVGFILMVPPGDQIMHRLFDSGYLEWFHENTYTAENCAWIAKIAVVEPYKKRGIGKDLIARMAQKHNEASLLTTTALFPIRNNAIEATLRGSNMNREGIYVSAAGVNTLWASRRTLQDAEGENAQIESAGAAGSVKQRQRISAEMD